MIYLRKRRSIKKIAEEAKKAYDEGSTSKGKHESGGKKKLFKGGPKRPPQSGYGLFSSEKLSELTHVDSKHRMTEIAKSWKSMSTAEKDQYAESVQEMMTI
ncbi:hypothetical protein AVEN_224725-1 [Araneus ventricosus]|uniref:HMG box domain-containing protein n=1 Tax=Araneus ventricosus TaxID=182803 RepID=A0A4Y2I268_ARAVE|nr:hypothetical protein AVEN_224725-1 [Araneus ventricosus]